MRTHCLSACVGVLLAVAGASAGGEGRRSIIFKTPGPEGMVNPCADRMNKAMRKFKKKLPAQGRREYGQFFNWAVWAYLSGDSEHRGDRQLLTMIRLWLDQAFERLSAEPEDPATKKDWRPDRLGKWFFHAYSTPYIEIVQDERAIAAIGRERLGRLRKILVANFEGNDAAKHAEQIEKYKNYINMLYHLYPYMLADYLITGSGDALAFCEKTNAHLAEQQNPNGSYPYRLGLHGPGHREADSMYYHAIVNRGLYLHWWYTGSERAEAILKKSVPYYPLSIEPPYHFSSGADIWWKDQWRTFWPHHIAMVAAATGDGENAAIARRMGAEGKSVDWFDNVIGAHAYRLLAERKVESTPVRDNYIVRDPDIRGVRSRWGDWSTLLSTGSFGFSRTSAMLTDGQRFDALHMARPVFRTRPYPEKPNKVEPGVYSCMNRTGDVELATAIRGEAGAVGVRYRQALTAKTWREEQPLSPWRTDEVWLIAPEGLVGLIRSTATTACKGCEMMHQYRFIHGRKGPPDGQWSTGRIAMRVWKTNFPHRIRERARRYVFDTKSKKDCQVTLSDSARSPLEVLHTPGAEKDLPEEKEYAEGTVYFSLVSITPKGNEPEAVEPTEVAGRIGFSVVALGVKDCEVKYDPASGELELRTSMDERPGKAESPSSGGESRPQKARED